MFPSPTQLEVVSTERRWTDAGGRRWSATLIWYPRRPADECEIQVDGEGVAPERVLCLGLREGRFPKLTWEELELIRRAARTRNGIVWVDARDGQLWWVREHLLDDARVQPIYANGSWSGFPRFRVAVPITFLRIDEHERLLDDARQRAPTASDARAH